jgi:hypothetical protein
MKINHVELEGPTGRFQLSLDRNDAVLRHLSEDAHAPRHYGDKKAAEAFALKIFGGERRWVPAGTEEMIVKAIAFLREMKGI